MQKIILIIRITKVTSVSFVIPNFFFFKSCKLNNFRFKCYIESFYIEIILKPNKITILSQFFLKNLKKFLLPSSVMKKIVVFATNFELDLQ